ncbi:MAG: amino acid-binding protein [Firmicutes bacterium]|nr:amino acid-binding protein [Bacillota bacterium]
MILRQISVFLENKRGTLAQVLNALNENGVNLRAMTVADTADFGILRIVVNDPDKVEQILKDANYAVKITPVLTMKIEDSPGGLMKKVKLLTDNGINIEYIYAFASTDIDGARVVLKVDNLEQASQIMRDASAAEDGDYSRNCW